MDAEQKKRAEAMDGPRTEAGKERSDAVGEPGRRRAPRSKRDSPASEHEASDRPRPWRAGENSVRHGCRTPLGDAPRQRAREGCPGRDYALQWRERFPGI